MSKLTELKKKLEDMRKDYAAAAKDAFANEAKDLFAEHPGLKSFSWTQYAPYFNDGDPCTFSAHTDYPHIKFEGVESSRAPYEKAGLDVIKFLSAFDDNVLEELFGDSVKVVVTAEGTETEEYDHD